MNNRQLVSYCDQTNPLVRFVQYKDDPLPVWAHDVKDEGIEQHSTGNVASYKFEEYIAIHMKQ